MNKAKFYRIIENICPSELAESWDNCGIQIDSEFDEVEKVLVALEITDEVIDEAIEKNVDTIVTHHPLIFGSIKQVNYGDATGRYIYRLIRNGISVYSCHTSFDNMEGGNNDFLGYALGLKEIERFEEGSQMCRKGVTPFEISLSDFVRGISNRLSIDERKLRVVGDPAASICTVGWCTGAGADFLEDAAAENLDLFITGDLKYHEAQMAKSLGIAVIDAGHYGTEKIFVENMAQLLAARTNCEILKSRVDIDPFV